MIGIYFKKFLILVLVCVLLVVFSGCEVDRSGTGWEQSVNPSLICPGDPVTVRWNLDTPMDCVRGTWAGIGGCPPPPSVNITSSPNLFAGDTFPTGELDGNLIVHPEVETHFTLNSTYEGRELATYDYDVQLVLPEREFFVPLLFNGTCDGTRPTWDFVVPHNDPSERVKVVRICNSYSDLIQIQFEGAEPITLFPGECRQVNEKPGHRISLLSAPSAIVNARCYQLFKRDPDNVPINVVLACTPQ
jgi:hypothetical protein